MTSRSKSEQMAPQIVHATHTYPAIACLNSGARVLISPIQFVKIKCAAASWKQSPVAAAWKSMRWLAHPSFPGPPAPLLQRTHETMPSSWRSSAFSSVGVASSAHCSLQPRTATVSARRSQKVKKPIRNGCMHAYLSCVVVAKERVKSLYIYNQVPGSLRVSS